MRPPRRSERYPSLVRVDTINGTPADEVADGTRYEDLPCAFPTERLRSAARTPTVQAIEWLTPFGKGSRVAIVGPAARRKDRGAAPHRRGAVAAGDGSRSRVVLAGVRPEEVADWGRPGRAGRRDHVGASPDTQAQAIERVVEQARRVAARGRDAVVLIDGSTACTRRPRARRSARRATWWTRAR